MISCNVTEFASSQVLLTPPNVEVVAADANNTPPLITRYNYLTALVLRIISCIGLGPGIVQVQDSSNNDQIAYLNKNEAKAWVRFNLRLNPENDLENFEHSFAYLLLRVYEIGTVELKSTPIAQGALTKLSAKVENIFKPKAKKGEENAGKNAKKINVSELKYQTKGNLYERAIQAYEAQQLNQREQVTFVSLPDEFLTRHNFTDLPYLLDSVKPDFRPALVTSDFYDYVENNEAQDSEHYWVDFANRQLGGGALGLGFVQEEVMVIEIPRIAEHIATQRTFVRVPNENTLWEDSDRAGKGNPDPLLIRDVYRVGKVNVPTYSEIIGSTFEPLDQPQKLNILAMAAPNLGGVATPELQTSEDALNDLFNTLVAGFRLAKENAHQLGKKCTICTGAIGGGAFGNDRSAIYALQMLAAQYVGVDELKIYGYSLAEGQAGRATWDAVCKNQTERMLSEIIKEIGVAARPYAEAAYKAAQAAQAARRKAVEEAAQAARAAAAQEKKPGAEVEVVASTT